MNSLEELEGRIAPAGLLFAAGAGTVSVSVDSNNDGMYDDGSETFVPFANYKGPVTVASGDFDGDGNAELVTAIGKGKNAQVKIWDLTAGGKVGALIESFTPFSGSKSSGLSVAAGDLDNDGKAELIIGAGPGGSSSVKVYSDINGDGKVFDQETDSFNAFDAKFKGGVRVAAGDTNNTGGAELIAAAWSKGGMVTVYTDSNNDRLVSNEAPVESATPFGEKFKMGFYVSSGLVDGAGGSGAEIVLSAAKGAARVSLFSDTTANGTVFDDDVFDSFDASQLGFKQGAAVALGDTDGSGTFAELVVGAGGGSGSLVRILDDNGDMGSLLSDNEGDFQFNPFAKLSGGYNLAFGKVTSATFTSTVVQGIPDNSTVTSSIFVPAGTGTIRDLDVGLSIAHTFDSDLDVTLTHIPSGISIILFTDVAGTDAGFIVRISDESGTDIGTADNADDGAVTGQFNPEGAAVLSVFDTIDAAGEWRLSITDDTASDTGALYNWSLYFTT